MDSIDHLQASGRPSLRRELQLHGPRPTPLKVSKDSHKIKKPPLAPQHQTQNAKPAPPAQHRPPVIIYTLSPKVFHIKANEFMSMVQRLTGLHSCTSAGDNTGVGALSPAARLAVVEKTAGASAVVKPEDDMDVMEQLGINDGVRLAGPSPTGILSPVPSSLLPPVSPNLFSLLPDASSLNFLHELSPVFHGNSNGNGSFFAISPGNLLSTALVPSPSTYWDLFNNLKDF
ncbi:hypothetical protein HPP92_011631 [Vanilla planifolia]|uniref:VQ domain-containing protein n=1 Tax=Vanilla planifolia TaxID=51239 RepID=A0A835V300_VANPL|nr:hypothetical protein HPP92_011631 [Vanilla planifolia]